MYDKSTKPLPYFKPIPDAYLFRVAVVALYQSLIMGLLQGRQAICMLVLALVCFGCTKRLPRISPEEKNVFAKLQQNFKDLEIYINSMLSSSDNVYFIKPHYTSLHFNVAKQLKCWSTGCCYHNFHSTLFDCWHTSLQCDTHSQND